MTTNEPVSQNPHSLPQWYHYELNPVVGTTSNWIMWYHFEPVLLTLHLIVFVNEELPVESWGYVCTKSVQ